MTPQASKSMSEHSVDLLVIGGGINGSGIALDAAGRGLSVMLCEQSDLASETSSYSSKLIHGGLRYLEYYEFRLVREALKEREILMKIAPHLIHPLRLVMPHNASQRPRWMVRAGLFLYDHLNWGQSLPKCHSMKIESKNADEPLNDITKFAYAYSDCTVDDSRLVLHLALAAKEKGASICTHHQVQSIERVKSGFTVQVLDQAQQQAITIHTKAIANAAGPWVDDIVKNKAKAQSKHHIRLIKGSHLIVPKLYEGDQAYLLQNEDHRIVFVIPYRNDFTLIGTTDIPYEGDPHAVTMDHSESSYLLSVVNRYFKKQLSESDITWHYSGVRALQSDNHGNPSKVTRDYALEIDASNGAPFLSVFGGKVTTYRRLAEQAIDHLSKYFPSIGPSWTKQGTLPGGNFNHFNDFCQELLAKHPFLGEEQAHRIAYAYGTRAYLWLKKARSWGDLGQDFGHGLTQGEVDFMIETEWAQSLEDILWRRSKMILRMNAAQKQALQDYLERL